MTSFIDRLAEEMETPVRNYRDTVPHGQEARVEAHAERVRLELMEKGERLQRCVGCSEEFYTDGLDMCHPCKNRLGVAGEMLERVACSRCGMSFQRKRSCSRRGLANIFCSRRCVDLRYSKPQQKVVSA